MGRIPAPAAYAGWRKTAQNMAVPRRFNPLGPGKKNSEPRKPGVGTPTSGPLEPMPPLSHVPSHTPPGAGTFQSRVRRPSPRAPGPAPSCPGTCRRGRARAGATGERATPNLNPGVARQMADSATWA
ncbi:hypothetical protein GCM10010266_38650 [Streptomyces griseomycini]|nr:hypothetical protein GCM10010266_38650 [Streptomyces griseomycini]GGR26361.1 hypothetical protein GCM10015536_35070 [Streptomyces griseomycini]